MKNSKKKAQSLIEYSLILALVAVVAVGVIGKLTTAIQTTGEKAVTSVTDMNSKLDDKTKELQTDKSAP